MTFSDSVYYIVVYGHYVSLRRYGATSVLRVYYIRNLVLETRQMGGFSFYSDSVTFLDVSQFLLKSILRFSVLTLFSKWMFFFTNLTFPLLL